MDVGASGAPLPIWNDIAPASVYVGFDPDLREIHEDRSSQFHRSVMVNEAVIAGDAPEVTFYLTKSPFCSTTLGPNPAATRHWLEADKFEVEGVGHVRATTIESVMSRLNISRIDWIKLDTQGVDLRLINSIPPAVLSRVLAIDTEPGLIEIYQGEDMFVDVHRDLTARGFWLSGMHTGGFVRMRRATLDLHHRTDARFDEPYMRSSIRTSPAYLEARYLRTLEWLREHRFAQEEYALLWIFAMTDNQLGFALDVSAEFEELFGENDIARTLKRATYKLLDESRRRHVVGHAPGIRHLRSVLGRLRRRFA